MIFKGNLTSIARKPYFCDFSGEVESVHGGHIIGYSVLILLELRIFEPVSSKRHRLACSPIDDSYSDKKESQMCALWVANGPSFLQAYN